MKKIVIKTCDKSKWLRKEALECVKDWEANCTERKEGVLHGVLTCLTTNTGDEYRIHTYHTKTSIITDVRKTSEG